MSNNVLPIPLLIVMSLFLSVVPISVIIVIRQTVKIQRQETIKDLEAIFDLPHQDESTGILASFEFVKYKYFMDRVCDSSKPRDFEIYHWVVSAVPLMCVLFAFSFYCLFVIALSAFNYQPPEVLSGLAKGPIFPGHAWVTVAAFLGATVSTLRALFRAINNFDLSPASFVSAMINIVMSVALAQIFYFAFLVHFQGDGGFGPSPLMSAAVVTAFAIGYFPDIARRNLLKSSRLRSYKTESPEIYRAFRVTPVEVIDGIDSEIRDRLADFNISSVQNLAASNPLMLFVETPYGVYQIIDWVAQAQLCEVIGASQVTEMWKFGIRTIFDLERLVLHDDCRNDHLIQAISERLIPHQRSDQQAGAGEDGPRVVPAGGNTEPLIVAVMKAQAQCIHVQRLRQIINRIADRLGEDSLALKSSCKWPLRKAA